MKKMKNKILIPICFLIFAACGGSEDIEKFSEVENKYDPSRPKEVVSFSPLVGRIDDNFVIEGNFGTDIAEMKVYFGERQAVLLNTNGQTLHGIVPKQPAGNNPITVVLGKDSIITDFKFHYRQFQNVAVVAGDWEKRESDGWGGWPQYDGALSESSFAQVLGLTVVSGKNLIVGETWFARLRFVSFEDNKVITLMGNWTIKFDQGAVNSTGDVAYFLQVNDSHILYKLEKTEGWVPVQLNQGIPGISGEVCAPTFANDDRYIYIRNNTGDFGRIDVTQHPNYPYEMLLRETVAGTEGRTKLCYCKYSDCFYATQPDQHGIYKIWQDKTTQEWKIEKYAGFNGTGFAEGDRLADAQFAYPMGICADPDGNVYVTNQSNNTIFKIWLKTGQVEHVAGSLSWSERPTGGLPLESNFSGPASIAIDEDENFFIGNAWGSVIHKYSIE